MQQLEIEELREEGAEETAAVSRQRTMHDAGYVKMRRYMDSDAAFYERYASRRCSCIVKLERELAGRDPVLRL